MRNSSESRQESSLRILNQSQGKYFVFMSPRVSLTHEHLSIFYHNILTDHIFYFTNCTEVPINQKPISHFQTLYKTSFPEDFISYSFFIAATKDTWLSIAGLPPNNHSLHDWIMKRMNGYHAIQFQANAPLKLE